MPEPRTYVVGLPVLVTVHDDGTIEYEVDTSEAGESIWEYENDDAPTEEQRAIDQPLIDADHERRHREGVHDVKATDQTLDTIERALGVLAAAAFDQQRADAEHVLGVVKGWRT